MINQWEDSVQPDDFAWYSEPVFKRGPRTNNRLFMDAVLWMARAGARWRDLPERLGDHRTVKRRYYDWIERGVFADIFAALGSGPTWNG